MATYAVMTDPRRGEMREIGTIEVAEDGAVTITNSGDLDGYFIQDSKKELFSLLRKHYPYVFMAKDDEDE